MKNHTLSPNTLLVCIVPICIHSFFSSFEFKYTDPIHKAAERTSSAYTTASPFTSTLTTSSGSFLMIDCFRKTVNHSKSPSDFFVEVTIKKENIKGSTKLTEILPPGFSATLIESQGATFIFIDQKATFIWNVLPEATEFKISYKVSVAKNVSGMQTIEGIFYFVENDRTMKFVLPHTSINIIDPAVNPLIAANPTPNPKIPITTTLTPTAPKAPVVDYYQIKKPKGSKKLPVGNIYYKVQFLALYQSGMVTTTPIVSDSVIGEPFETTLTQGFLQYSIGPFATFDEASKHKEDMVLKGYPGSFIKAYMNKRRITIKEARALQETKQNAK